MAFTAETPTLCHDLVLGHMLVTRIGSQHVLAALSGIAILLTKVLFLFCVQIRDQAEACGWAVSFCCTV